MNRVIFPLILLVIFASAGIYIWKNQGANLTANISAVATSTNANTTSTPTSTIPETTSSPAQSTTTPPAKTSSSPAISVLKSTLYQGDPLYVSFSGGTPVSAAFNGKPMFLFQFNGSTRAIAPIPPALAPGNYTISAQFSNNQTAAKTVHVYKYNFVVIPTQPFNGTTSPEEAAQLEREALDFQSSFKSPTPAADFASTFIVPLHIPVSIASPFGETRVFPDGSQSRHLGTDFRAPVGTPVYSVNDGIVIKVKNYLDYGNTVVIDHGAGIYSVYMHLSRADVSEGQRILRNQRIGLTGATGFVSGPHLHLSIRIGDFSVDPMRFFPTVK